MRYAQAVGTGFICSFYFFNLRIAITVKTTMDAQNERFIVTVLRYMNEKSK